MDFHTVSRTLVRMLAPATSGAVLAAALAIAPTADAAGDDARRVVEYVVRPGDTATGLAVRYHAWTDELIRLNHLGPDAALYVGERIRIPIVVRRAAHHTTRHHSTRHSTSTRHHSTHHSTHSSGIRHHYADPSRATVRRITIETAHRYGIDPTLALAIGWQEAGWQMHHVSSAGAIGAMQVMPDTGRWMSIYAGRRLDLHHTRDNITAGVLLIRVLRDMVHGQREQIAAYYQGVGSVQHGHLLAETLRYVANVRAIQRMLHHGWNPA